jgi:hypothetical protein
VTNRIVDGWGLNSCGLDATVPFSTVARRWQRLASNKIRFALHPAKNFSEEDRNRAVQMWEELKLVLVAEGENPTSTYPTMEQMMRNREENRRAHSERSKAAHARAKAKREGQ